MKLKLPGSVASQQDLGILEREISEYARWATHESIKQRSGIKHMSEPPALSPASQQLVREWQEQDLDELIETLKKYGNNAPLITITLAAPPPNSLKTILVDWCRKNIAPNVLVNFRFNTTLLGGMVITIGSHVFDWSFRRQLLAARERFPEVLRRV